METEKQNFEIFDSSRKYRIDQVIAVGDGANDLPMLNIAGLGIAFSRQTKRLKRKCQTIYLINRF